MFIKTASILSVLIVSSAVVLVNAQPKPEPGFTTTILRAGTSSLGRPSYNFAAAPPSDACQSCINNGINKISDCNNLDFPPSGTPVDQLTAAQKKCICTLSKTPATTWSQGCVSATLCSQDDVNTLSQAVTTLGSQGCVAGASNNGSPSLAQGSKSAAVAVFGVAAAVAYF
ncbi:hypothetical protein BGZ83_005100 [Gryganskiella cystojenkinii]|nr:hypothetical protein BGZ83_005100 [Gryganskiella cystojenkinii]